MKLSYWNGRIFDRLLSADKKVVARAGIIKEIRTKEGVGYVYCSDGKDYRLFGKRTRISRGKRSLILLYDDLASVIERT